MLQKKTKRKIRMSNFLKKIKYIPTLINDLYWQAVDQEIFAESCDPADCKYNKRWHEIQNQEMRDILGPFSYSPKINSLKKIMYIKEMIRTLRNYAKHEIELAEEHDTGKVKGCKWDKSYHLDMANVWVDILGPWFEE